MTRTSSWKVSDALWEQVEPLLPVRPPHPKGGRPASFDRQMFSALIYVLRMGVASCTFQFLKPHDSLLFHTTSTTLLTSMTYEVALFLL